MSSSSSSTTTTSTMTTTRRRKLTQRKTFAGTFTLANEGAQSFGWDGLFAAWFPLVFVVVLATAHWLRNPWFALWFAFGLLPVLDLVVPMDEANPTPEDEKKYANALSYRVPLYVWTVAQTAIFFWAVHHFCTSPEMLQASLSHQIGFVLAVGVLGGLGINVSHELVHKVRTLDRACAYVLLCLVNYMHFALEHRSGHHKNVSTPLDPASARKGQNVYGFYLQSVVGGWRSAWEIECTRLERMGVSKWSTENVMLWFAGCPAVLAAALGFHFGPRAVVFFFIQGWVAHVLLEAINMIEHYALERKEVSPGVYEPVSILHSWNAPHRITNMFLMKLQRHSDHHAHAMRPYHLLRSFEESPMLPTGYAGCTLMALASPIWSNVMDPLAAAYTDPKTDPAAKQATIRSAVRKTTAFSWFTFFVLSYVCLF